ncbi:HEPN domain-containing protein [Candidatus Babeliales bacterium]|nr:HEPN domain-containing protein [Candidatus Babeliales bacterium]
MPGIKDWLKKASSDLKSAKMLSKDDDVLDVAVFHTHQCAEKALKTYLVFCQSPILKTHDLPKLLEVCVQKDPSFKELLNEVLSLNSYGTYSRYPDDRFSIDQEEAARAVKYASRIFDFVEKKIKPPDNKTLSLFEK